MLQAHNRLRRSEDVNRVRKSGRRWRHPLAVLLVAPRVGVSVSAEVHESTSLCSRFAFSASRRVGNAIVRNRGKRLLREAVRLHLADIETGLDCLFIVREQTAGATFLEVEAAVLQLLSRAHVLTIGSS